MTLCATKPTTWTKRVSRTKPVTRSLEDTPVAALLSTYRKDEDSFSLRYRHAAAVPPTLNKEEEDTAVGANSSLHQQHEGVAAACLRPLG